MWYTVTPKLQLSKYQYFLIAQNLPMIPAYTIVKIAAGVCYVQINLYCTNSKLIFFR